MIVATAPRRQNFSHEWKTSIQKGINGKEKRSSLFTWPRLRLESDFIFTDYNEYCWMRRNLYKHIHDLWEIPIWYDRTTLTQQAVLGQKVITIGDSNNRHFYVGRACILINGSSYEKRIIASVDSSTQITLVSNLDATWPIGTLVLPLYRFRIKPTQKIRSTQKDFPQTISFDAMEEFELVQPFSYTLPESGLPTYLNHDLLLFDPRQSISSSFSHPYDFLQTFGYGYETSHYDETELGLSLSFSFVSNEETWGLLKTFDSKRGRLKSFWIPSWNKDIIVTSPILATDDVLTITDLEYSTYYLPNNIINRHIWIKFPNGNWICRKIISAPTSTTIKLNDTIGTAVGADDLSSLLVSFLIYSRFDIEDISFSHSVQQRDVVNVNLKTKGLVEEEGDMIDHLENTLARLSTTVVSFAGTGETTIYTVPTGKIMTPVFIIIRAGASAGTTQVTFGRVGALTDFLTTRTLSNLDADGDQVSLKNLNNLTPTKQKTYAAGVEFQVDVTSASGGAGNKIDLFGYLADA